MEHPLFTFFVETFPMLSITVSFIKSCKRPVFVLHMSYLFFVMTTEGF